MLDASDVSIYNPYFNYATRERCSDEIKTYIKNKKLGRKSLNKKNNKDLVDILVNLILTKNPVDIMNNTIYDVTLYQYRKYTDDVYHGMSIQYKNPYGVIISIINKNKVCACKKHIVSYEYIRIVYHCPRTSLFCEACLHKYITFSIQMIMELSKPVMIELFFILKETIIHELIPDVFYVIFKTLLMCNQSK